MWSYRCYDDGKQPNLWKRWYDSHEDFQGSHDSVFEILEQQDSWRMPGVKPLGDGLKEVRLNGKVKWRILGFHPGKKRHEFVVVSTCFHKVKVYTPKDAIETAKGLMNDIQSGKRKALACERPQ